MLRPLILLLFLAGWANAQGSLDRLRQLCHDNQWDAARAELGQLIAEQPDPTVLEAVGAFPEFTDLLRQPGWLELEGAYFARLDQASEARADVAYEFRCRGIKEQWARFYIIANHADFSHVRSMDEENTLRLKQIVAEQGWPRPSVWGQQAAQAAWMILQHSPDTEFQAQMLPILEQRLAEKECPGPLYALLYDRVQLRHGKEQRYGSQVQKQDGQWQPAPPLEDPEHLDERRASVGLQPIRQYLEGISKMYDQKKGWFH